MDSGHSKSKLFTSLSSVTDHMVLIGFGLAVIYWLLDSFLSIFLSHDHFLEKMFGIDLYNVWGRIIVLCMFAIFGSHAQFTINERKAAAEKMERDAATRERFRRLLSPDLAEMVVNGKLSVEKGGGKPCCHSDVCGYPRVYGIELRYPGIPDLADAQRLFRNPGGHGFSARGNR